MLYFAWYFGRFPRVLVHASPFLFSCCWLLWLSLLWCGLRRCHLCPARYWWPRFGGLRPRRRCCHPFGGAVCAGVCHRFAAACRARGAFVGYGVGCGWCWRCAGRVSGCWAALPRRRSPWLRLLWRRLWVVGLVCAGCAVGRGGAGVVIGPASCLAGFRWAFARIGLVVPASGCRRAYVVRVGPPHGIQPPSCSHGGGFSILLVLCELSTILGYILLKNKREKVANYSQIIPIFVATKQFKSCK